MTAMPLTSRGGTRSPPLPGRLVLKLVAAHAGARAGPSGSGERSDQAGAESQAPELRVWRQVQSSQVTMQISSLVALRMLTQVRTLMVKIVLISR